MNIHQIKQWVQNNLRYEENSRKSNREMLQAALPLSAKMEALSALVQPDYSRSWGIDISGKWDGYVDLSVTKSMGASFAYLKGADGTIHDDTYYPVNRQKALDADLPHGPYFWLYRNSNVSGVAQAQSWANFVNKYPPVLNPVFDFEWTKYGGQPANPTYSDLRITLTEWIRLGNPPPDLYSAKGFMDEYGQIPSDIKAMIRGLFIASYNEGTPYMPLGYKSDEWLKWQFTPSGDMAILAPNSFNTKEVDLSYSAGEAPTSPDGGTMYQCKVKSTATPYVNLREQANLSSRDIGDITPNTEFQADELVNGFLHAITPFIGYVSAQFVDYSIIITPPPDKQPFDVAVMVVKDGYRDGFGTVHMEPK